MDMKYGLADKKKYPMPDRDHVMSAIKFFNYVSPSDEAELARNINARIREYGIKDINVGEKNRFKKYYKRKLELTHGDEMNSYNEYPENDYRNYLEHGTFGKTWEWANPKYIAKTAEGVYVYTTEQLNNLRKKGVNFVKRGFAPIKRAARTIKNAPDVIGQRKREKQQRKKALAELPSERERKKTLEAARADINSRYVAAQIEAKKGLTNKLSTLSEKTKSKQSSLKASQNAKKHKAAQKGSFGKALANTINKGINTYNKNMQYGRDNFGVAKQTLDKTIKGTSTYNYLSKTFDRRLSDKKMKAKFNIKKKPRTVKNKSNTGRNIYNANISSKSLNTTIYRDDLEQAYRNAIAKKKRNKNTSNKRNRRWVSK